MNNHRIAPFPDIYMPPIYFTTMEINLFKIKNVLNYIPIEAILNLPSVQFSTE